MTKIIYVKTVKDITDCIGSITNANAGKVTALITSGKEMSFRCKNGGYVHLKYVKEGEKNEHKRTHNRYLPRRYRHATS